MWTPEKILTDIDYPADLVPHIVAVEARMIF